MTVIAIGLNHRSAPLEVLEDLAISNDVLPKALVELTSGEFVNEAVVLSTCNRTEVYVHGERFHDAYREVRDALGVLAGVRTDAFTDHLYVHYHDEAVRHLFAVAGGLDSAILGEHEILGQVRIAWDASRAEGAAGALLGPLFEHAIRAGKRVRTETAIGRRTASLSHAAVDLISERCGDLAGSRVLLVGAGEVGTGVAIALNKAVDIDLTVSNRTHHRAEVVASSLGGRVAPFEELATAMRRADVVISATGATGPVIDVDAVITATVGRDERLLILDLAVPRDVDPGVLTIDSVDLLVLSDLQAFANRGMEERQREAVAAGRLIDEEIEAYRATSSAQQVSPLLGSLHRWAEAVRQSELERQRAKGAVFDADTEAQVDALTKAIVAKLLHEPSARLRSTAGTRRGDRLAEALRELYDLS